MGLLPEELVTIHQPISNNHCLPGAAVGTLAIKPHSFTRLGCYQDSKIIPFCNRSFNRRAKIHLSAFSVDNGVWAVVSLS